MTYDIAIIGAGPCGLAVAARLCEATPSALFTDSEHARYWQRFHNRATLESEMRKRKPSTDSGYESFEDRASENNNKARPSMIVLDAKSDQWLTQWKEHFASLRISHLRSPLFFHPDPRDRDGLLAYAHEQEREHELVEIENVVGKELSKHEKKRQKSRRPSKRIMNHLRIDGRDRIDYFTPTTELFNDYCADIVSRYELQHVVHRAKVHTMKYGDIGCRTDSRFFEIETDIGTYLSKIVILAVGPGVQPSIPKELDLMCSLGVSGSASHCFSAGTLDLPNHVRLKIRAKQKTDVVVVGGGLTSAQVADLIIAQGVSKVWLLIRGRYKLKHFDVDLGWVSKCRNQNMATFWSAETDEERLEMLKNAKNGGSITPRFDKKLKQHLKDGRLSIRSETTLENCKWQIEEHAWTMRTNPPIPELPEIDHIVFATGVGPVNVGLVPCLHDILQDNPIEEISGLPKVNEDLMWNDDLPLFCTGALAALRLGPGAANLAGARQGAERITWKVEQLLAEGKRQASRSSSAHCIDNDERRDTLSASIESLHRSLPAVTSLEDRSAFTGGFSNQYEALSGRDYEGEE